MSNNDNSKLRNRRLFEFIGWMFVLFLLLGVGVFLVMASPTNNDFETLKADITTLAGQYKGLHTQGLLLRKEVKNNHTYGASIDAAKLGTLKSIRTKLENTINQLAADTSKEDGLTELRIALVNQYATYIDAETDLLKELEQNDDTPVPGGDCGPIQTQLANCQHDLTEARAKLQQAKGIVDVQRTSLQNLVATTIKYKRFGVRSTSNEKTTDKTLVEEGIKAANLELGRIRW